MGDYYKILECDKNSGEDVLKKAYRKLALKLHPDKNHAPGAEEAFKKLSKAFQCLTDEEKRHVYDRYGDEESAPQRHRQQYQQNFMSADDLFAAFFNGGAFPQAQQHHGGGQRQQQGGGGEGQQNPGWFQLVPILFLIFITVFNNLGSSNDSGRFSFSQTASFRHERQTASMDTRYFVSDDFGDHYPDGTRNLAEFERNVELYHVRTLQSECDHQEKTMYKKVMIAKRKGSEADVKVARKHPKPACSGIEKVKREHPNIYRSAMYG